jgi:DNA-3-methyladenine glycosylase
MENSNVAALKIGTGNRLARDFFTRTDVTLVARELLGKILVTGFDGVITAGMITETEAYRAPDDRACHAYGNRRTQRTEVMFHEGGRAYIYLCYGIHHLFNVVTGPAEMAHAVLIRAIEPVEGIDRMLQRRGHKTGLIAPALTTGPGALSQALGLTTAHTGQYFSDESTPVWIEDRGIILEEADVVAGKRIGVDYAGECAGWPWRYWIKNSRFVKKGKDQNFSELP